MAKKKASKKIERKVAANKPEIKEQARQRKPLINVYYVIGIIAVILALTFIGFNYNNIFGKNIQKIPTCGDGSFYDTCSIRKPYLCDNGKLIEAAKFCGCPDGFVKKEDSCVSSLTTNQKSIVLPYMLSGQRNQLSLNLYKGVYDYLGNASRSISYTGDEIPFRVDFKFMKINEENQKQALDPLVVSIENSAKNKEDQARIAISLVQNIPFGESKKRTKVGNSSMGYSRYPYEVLYDGAGVCGEKSELLAFLLKEMGYGTVLFYNKVENHEALGIACPVEQSYWHSGYCFVETSGPSIISDQEITYVGNLKLTSKPQILFISSGIALPSNLQEYIDAKTYDEIRSKVEAGKRLGSIDSKKLGELNAKYGLVEIYNA